TPRSKSSSCQTRLASGTPSRELQMTIHGAFVSCMRSLRTSGKAAALALLLLGNASISAAQPGDEASELNKKLMELYSAGRYADAVPVAQQIVAIREKALGRDHPNVATSLNNLATLYLHYGRYADAEPLYQRSLAIREKALGDDHRDVATSLNNLAELHRR